MKKIFLLSIIALGLSSCNKKEAVELKFNVAAEKTSYSVGDTVNFKIFGNPDQLTFYSGEEGRVYANKDRLFITSNKVTLEFASHRRYGQAAAQPKTLTLWASQTHSGNSAGFSKDDWIDISSAFTFSGFDNAENYTPSGVVDVLALSDIGFTIDRTKPVYFAFRYEGITHTSSQPRIWVNKFDLNAITTEGKTIPVVTLSTAGWNSLLVNGNVNWIIDGGNNTSRLRHQGAAANTVSNEAWVFTRPINLSAEIPAIPDKGVALKNMDTRMDEYDYVYTQPGTYKVTFVASNENVYGGANKVVKELEIVVNP
ncbi:DUF5017 domain-containing protein [Pseudoxanthomonas sp. SGD-10]|nr:DUF5017 domain-containing protein [Pseudoxanthomonas sp. SGD-10]